MNDSQEIAPDGEERDPAHIVELCEASNPAEAAAIRATLEDSGIEAEVVGGMAGNAFDLPMNVSALQVWVRAGDLERARVVLAETRRRHDNQAVEEDKEE